MADLTHPPVEAPAATALTTLIRLVSSIPAVIRPTGQAAYLGASCRMLEAYQAARAFLSQERPPNKQLEAAIERLRDGLHVPGGASPAEIKQVRAGDLALVLEALGRPAYVETVKAYFVVIQEPDVVPAKKGGWRTHAQMVAFLRGVALHNNLEPGSTVTVVQLTWNDDLWLESAEGILEEEAALDPEGDQQGWIAARAHFESYMQRRPDAEPGQELSLFRRTIGGAAHG